MLLLTSSTITAHAQPLPEISLSSTTLTMVSLRISASADPRTTALAALEIEPLLQFPQFAMVSTLLPQ